MQPASEYEFLTKPAMSASLAFLNAGTTTTSAACGAFIPQLCISYVRGNDGMFFDIADHLYRAFRRENVHAGADCLITERDVGAT